MYKGQLEELSAGGNLSRSALNQNAFITVPFKKCRHCVCFFLASLR